MDLNYPRSISRCLHSRWLGIGDAGYTKVELVVLISYKWKIFHLKIRTVILIRRNGGYLTYRMPNIHIRKWGLTIRIDKTPTGQAKSDLFKVPDSSLYINIDCFWSIKIKR